MGKFWGSSSWGILAVSLLVLGVLVPEGCCQDTSCLNQLVPCLNYLNGTEDVPSSCCDPLQNVIKSDQQCICSMISNQGSNQAEQAGINVTEAQQLPARCGIHVNPLNCLSSGSPNTKNSVDNSSGIVLFPCWSMMVAAALSIALHILWCKAD
ncbi:non-specific lipid transfer protein GPI-anchored 30 [Manihot esculenta]|uniref:Bifunctional inhibitor/plant lipid transfer protein/seed storage helical domain-containing protein n=1 Tax=Manihot esculenta TaxID=3983 RepID=A0A2C9W3I5_MANES|nr:non-specific lipid transfer protein GPI-anchored 30 [Manihot esculenta]